MADQGQNNFLLVFPPPPTLYLDKVTMPRSCNLLTSIKRGVGHPHIAEQQIIYIQALTVLLELLTVLSEKFNYR